MGLKINLRTVFLCGFLISISSCEIGKKSKSDIEIVFSQDTLNVGYTYWWPESGPFIGNCGEELSLVFSGVITKLDRPSTEAGPLYTSQKGTIAVNKVFKIKEIGEKTYASQGFVGTDCFFESGLKEKDSVLVFCYDYEDDYSIPGKDCIVKIDGFENPLVQSIRKYIDSDDNPLVLKNDIGLWATYGYGRALESSIECREEVNASSEMPQEGR